MRKSWLPVRERVRDALDAMAWRGPDGAVLREVGDWFLGVARLTISDPAASQPLRCPRTGRWVLFNGAVTSAAAEWRRHGARARTRNDAELALLRLEAQGPAALAATSGPYALAVLDPADDRLWLARDPEGEKPLFVLEQDGRVVAFASTAGALRCLGVDAVLGPTEQARLLRFGFHLAPECGTRVLRGDLHGVWTAAGDGALQPVPVEARPTPPSGLREVLIAAVRRCATAEVPVGLALSGGVDSSCLAAALGRLGHRLPAYQFRAAGADDVERDLAARVARQHGLGLREVDAGAEVLRTLPALTRHTGLPQGDPSVLAAHALARAAAGDGVRVLLSGEGADELWLGYRRHRAAAWLPARGLPIPWRGGLGTGEAARLLRALVAPHPYDALLEVSPPAFLDAVLEPGSMLAARLPATGLEGAEGRERSLRRARRVDRRYYLRCDLLPKLDTATMAAGVEGRCPYLDPEVLALVQGQVEGRRTRGKRPLKRAFRRELPGPVLRQRKRGFGLPLDRWLREDDYLADTLLERRTLERGPLCRAGVRRMVDRHRRSRADLGHPLYLVAALEVYWRYLETSSPARSAEPAR